MTPAAIHTGHSVESIAPGAWVERCGGGCIIHATSAAPIVYAARQLGFRVVPSRRETRVQVTYTTYFTKAKAERAIELVRAASLPSLARGWAPEAAAANDTREAS